MRGQEKSNTRRSRRGVRVGVAAALAATALLGVAGPARAATTITLSVDGLTGNKAHVLHQVTVKGQLSPSASVPVTVTVTIPDATPEAGGKPVTQQISSDASGAFSFPITVNGCCKYQVTATTPDGSTQTVGFEVDVTRRMHNGSHGAEVRLFNHLLQKAGYYDKASGRFNHSTGLAVLAFRKVNRMHRKENYEPRIFKTLLQGRGSFNPEHTGGGRHVEADLNRQVLAFIEDGHPVFTFPISSGKPSTPTVIGTFSFYSKTPGYNQKQMLDANYFVGGYAVHGYHDVPNFPASHGCLRTPIPDARFMYGWIHLGDTIYVYQHGGKRGKTKPGKAGP